MKYVDADVGVERRAKLLSLWRSLRGLRLPSLGSHDGRWHAAHGTPSDATFIGLWHEHAA